MIPIVEVGTLRTRRGQELTEAYSIYGPAMT